MKSDETQKKTPGNPSEIKITVTEDEISYDLTFNLLENKISIQAIKLGDLFKVKYLKNLTLEEFYALNKMFKQFDDLGEIFESIKSRNEYKDAFNISPVDNNLKLIIKYPSLKENIYNEIPILLIPEEPKSDNIIPKLCDAIVELNNKIADLKIGRASCRERV